MNDLVSIVMPSYNTAEYISESIESVLAQTYQNWELIIVDDCSTDDTEKIVKQFSDLRIKFFRNQVNSGAAVSRNIALRKAKGKWVAFLDSDDLWNVDKLEKQICFMKKNECYFSYTGYEEIDEYSNPKDVFVTGPKKITQSGMYRYCWPGCLTVMYDRENVGEIQIPSIRKNNDYAIWLRVSKKADCYLLKENLASYRIRTGSISSQSKISLLKWHYRLFALEYNPILAFLFMIQNMIFGVYKKIVYVKRT